MESQNPDVFIHSVTFRPDDLVEIVYLETRNQTERAGASTSVVADWHDVVEEITELQENLRELVDKIWEHIRHPEMVAQRPRREGEIDPPGGGYDEDED